MKVLVCGGRNYTNAHKIFDVLAAMHQKTQITTVLHGAATGADSIAGAWARTWPSIEEIAVPAEWSTYGKLAGHKRNTKMLEHAPDLVLAFPGGPGTANMVKQARRCGVPVTIVEDKDWL